MEAARLLGTAVAAVQRDRIAAAQELAQRYRAHVVLKGCGSVVADPDGAWAINPTGNPGMASAGMGDVLSGLLGALLAQGWPVPLAARFGPFLHGAAADRLVAEGIGPIGITASETVSAARRLLNEWSVRA
jgi:NAD(P)H-hydrate repair Nnr-like enzyme with NAD(P)H-hydrate dehydratase domain